MPKHADVDKGPEMMHFKDSIVLITGGGSGIGLGLAREFLLQRSHVIICGRDREKLRQAQAQLPEVWALPCDVTDEQQCAAMLQQIEAKYGRLDVLVNNAGIYGRHDFFSPEFDAGEAERLMRTNFIAPIRLATQALPLLRRSSHPMLVNVTSGLAYAPLPRAPIYSATKSALHFFTAAIQRQTPQFPLHIVEVLPPVVDTAMAQHAQILKLSVPVFARRTMKALRKGKTEIRIGGSSLLYWAMRLIPSIALRVMNRF